MNIVDRELWRQTHEQLLRDNATYREFFSGNLDVLRPSVPAGAPGAATPEIPHAQQPKKIAVDPVNVDGVFSPQAKVASPVTPDIPRAATPTIAPHEAVQVYSTAMMAAREASMASLPGRAPVPQAPEVERPPSSPSIPDPSQNRTAAVVQNDAPEMPMALAARLPRPEAPAASANRSEIPNSSVGPVDPVDRPAAPRGADRPQSIVRTVFSRVAEAFGFSRAGRDSLSAESPKSALPGSREAPVPASPGLELAARPESPGVEIPPRAALSASPAEASEVLATPRESSLPAVERAARPESPEVEILPKAARPEVASGDIATAAPQIAAQPNAIAEGRSQQPPRESSPTVVDHVIRPVAPAVDIPPKAARPESPGSETASASAPASPPAAPSGPVERPTAPAADLPRYVRPGDAPAAAVSTAARPESPTAPQIAPAARPESAPVQRQGVESPSVASMASVPAPARPESPSATFARYVRPGDSIDGDFSKAARPDSPSVAVPPRTDRPVSPGVAAESLVSPLAPMVAVRPSVGPQSPSSPDLTHAARPDASPFSAVSPHPMRLPSLGVSPQAAKGQDVTADLLGKILKALEPKSQTPQYQPPAPPMARPLDRKFAHLLGGS